MVEQHESSLNREAMAEGIYYPFDKEEIISSLHQCSSKQSVSISPRTQLIVMPHGPLESVGALVAPYFNLLKQKKYSRIIYVGTTEGNENAVYLPESQNFITQLGSSPVDAEALDIIATSSLMFKYYDLPHLDELTFDVSLVFTHYYSAAQPIVPLLVSGSNFAQLRCLTAALKIIEQEYPGENLYVLHANLSIAGFPYELHKQNLRTAIMKQDFDAVIAMGKEQVIKGSGLFSLALAATLHHGAEPSIIRGEDDLITLSY